MRVRARVLIVVVHLIPTAAIRIRIQTMTIMAMTMLVLVCAGIGIGIGMFVKAFLAYGRGHVELQQPDFSVNIRHPIRREHLELLLASATLQSFFDTMQYLR